MWPVEGPVPLRAAFLLLGIWALWTSVLCFPGHPSWRYSSSEVVVPKKEVQSGKSLHFPGHISYSLRFGGQRHVIHLWKKRLLWPRHMVLATQDDQGTLQMDYPYFPEDCYFLGYLEDIPLSTVTVETCSGGMEGVMMLDDLTYEISPLRDSNRFEHIVSQLVANKNAMGPMYGLDHKDVPSPLSPGLNYSAEPRISSMMYSGHEAALKGIVQCSRSMYSRYENVSKCSEFLIHMFNIVDTLMRGIEFRFYISMVVVYSESDPVSFPKGEWYPSGMDIHKHYEDIFYWPFRPASCTLVLKEKPHESAFEPAPYSMCNKGSLTFVAALYRPAILLAIIAANQQGRMIGMLYDGSNCVCQRRNTCIMFRWPGVTDAFSNCSFVHIQHIVSNPSLNSCYYRSERVLYNSSITMNRCGNYVVEGQEQCDCGPLKECYTSGCCNTECTFTEGSSCDRGACCANCTHSPMMTLCRTVQNVCDLPEHCSGSDSNCPEDTYLQDGTPCSQDGYCYNGNCTDRTIHCKEIFGESAKNAEDACYSINLASYRFGHCGRAENELAYTPCTGADKMCGRLQCNNVTRLPILQEHVSFHQSYIDGAYCFGLDEHRSTGSTDAGKVRTGTPCGSGKMCIGSSCNTSINALDYDCLPEKCSYKGVCNNHRHCHCHVGWEPPNCDKLGHGGSVESGQLPKRVRTVDRNPELIIYLRLMYGRFYVFIAALLIAYALNAKTIKTVKEEEAAAGGEEAGGEEA
uniref:disintegrin and metalloproteinase domain-containing protein 21-like n=1 Tax=Ictidomys tridecemlineatus TaxID=43179 RepID=UPI00038BCC4C|nr:disintegrin and metalloproteinase domain-containing protein 21-like [Ictidomys tridecemlineatus]